MEIYDCLRCAPRFAVWLLYYTLRLNANFSIHYVYEKTTNTTPHGGKGISVHYPFLSKRPARPLSANNIEFV